MLCYVCHEKEHSKENSLNQKWNGFIEQFESIYPNGFNYLSSLIYSMCARYEHETFEIICDVLNSENGHNLVSIAEKLHELNNLLWEKDLNT